MIATILKSSSTFSAVRYNERKVEHGVAELVAIRNFGYLQDAPEMRGITSLRNYLMDYSARNDRTRMTQFHAAISCKGDEYSKEELIKIADQYLDKMGYNNDGQPVLMYFHHDTGNNHLHIVTSRISPDGKKISDSMENIRSLKAIESIMSIDQKHQNSEMMKLAKSYHFESVSQFMAVFETSGYEAYIQDKDIYIKRGGQVQDSIAVKDVEKLCRKNGEEEKKRIRQLRAILKKYRDQSSSREELEAMLKKKFGISLKFLGKEFTPYGYMVVDNATKSVFKGSDILSVKDLLQFQSREEKLQKVDFFIEDKLRENPLATTFDLNHDVSMAAISNTAISSWERIKRSWPAISLIRLSITIRWHGYRAFHLSMTNRFVCSQRCSMYLLSICMWKRMAIISIPLLTPSTNSWS